MRRCRTFWRPPGRRTRRREDHERPLPPAAARALYRALPDVATPDLEQVALAEALLGHADGALTCGGAEAGDGKPDTLQELALAIAAAGGGTYDAALDPDGADDRGIVAGFLYRTDRVSLAPVAADDPVLGSVDGVDYRAPGLASNADVSNPKALNADLPADVDTSTGTDGSNVYTRAPQVARFRVAAAPGSADTFDLWAVSNHFSSGPDGRVGQRREQARYAGAIADAVEAAYPGARVVVGGDLNVFPRPDDPFAPGDPLFPSDQLGPLYESGLTNLDDDLRAEVPASAYSYVFQGQAQTLDQLFVNAPLYDDLVQVRAAHVNADWPAEHPGDGPRGLSDHDPQVARFATRPAVTVSDVAVTEGDRGTTPADFTVSLSRPRTVATSGCAVAFGETARVGVDFEFFLGCGTIPAGETSMTVAVPVRGDRRVEPAEAPRRDQGERRAQRGKARGRGAAGVPADGARPGPAGGRRRNESEANPAHRRRIKSRKRTPRKRTPPNRPRNRPTSRWGCWASETRSGPTPRQCYPRWWSARRRSFLREN